MARSGTFGRIPRVAPNLTSTIVAIEREMQAREDQNVMDSWEKGGTFQGRKVTDDFVLDYWRKRIKVVDKDDPLADTYKQAVYHLDYRIHESKVTAAYALIKEPTAADDQRVANFYLGWAKKVPKDSEFYRELIRDSAQWTHAAQNKLKVNTDRLKEEKYQKDQAALSDKYSAIDQFTVALRNMAVTGNPLQPGLISTQATENLTDPNQAAVDFTGFDAGDPAGMLTLIETVNGMDQGLSVAERFALGPEAAASPVTNATRTLFKDPVTGKMVTNKDLLANVGKIIPGFDGHLDVKDIMYMIDRKDDFLARQQKLAQDTGHAVDADKWAAARAYNRKLGDQVEAWPVEKAYMLSKQAYENVINDPNALPSQKVAAWQQRQKDLIGFSGDKRIADQPALQNRFAAEARNDTTGPTVFEDVAGTGQRTSSEYAAQNKALVDMWTQQDAEIKSGKAVYTTGEYKDGVFQPMPGGSKLGTVPANDRAIRDGVQVLVRTPGSGQFVPVTLTPEPVNVTAIGANGDSIGVTNSRPVATAFTAPDGTTIFRRQDANGRTFFSSDFPGLDDQGQSTQAGQDVSISRGSNGLVIQYQVPEANGSQGVEGRAGIQSTAKTDANGVTTYTYSFDPGMFVTDIDTARKNTGGVDPYRNNADPNVALYKSKPEGTKLLTDMSQTPEWADLVDHRAKQQAGFIYDAKGNLVPGPNSNPAMVDQVKADANNNLLSSAPADPLAHASAFFASERAEANATGNPIYDSLNGTQFEKLASGVKNRLLSAEGFGVQPRQPDQSAVHSINVQGNITLPSNPYQVNAPQFGRSTGKPITATSAPPVSTGTPYTAPVVPTYNPPDAQEPPLPPPPQEPVHTGKVMTR